MKKKGLFFALFIVICAMIGAGIGFFMAASDLTIDLTLVDIIVFYLLFVLSLFLAINIHEFGHYFFGKLLGYQLIMYRIGIFSFTYENGKMKFEVIRNKGYSGLCAMIPPQDADFKHRKHLLYYGGGVTLNILSGVIILLLLPYVSSFYGRSFIYIFSISSILLGLINLAPFRTSGNQLTDGKVILDMLKKDENVSSSIQVMNLFTQMAGGIRPKELVLDSLELTNSEDPSILLLQYYNKLDQGDYNQVELLASKIIGQLDNFSTVTLPGIYNELITVGVLLDKPEWVDTYYDLNEKILMRDRDLNGERVKAHYTWYKGDFDQARKHIEQAESVAGKFPIVGQATMERMLIDKLAEKLNTAEAPISS